MSEFKSAAMKMYARSEFASTQAKMLALTPAQLAFADSVYADAESTYESGGQWVVEAMEPWEVVADFKTVADARAYMELKQDRYEDVRGS